MDVLAQEFRELFFGLERAYGKTVIGELNPKKGKIEASCSTIAGQLTNDLWVKHLKGEQGLGIVPIRDDATCLFGAIDIDVYDGLDLLKLEKNIANLPLVLCKTKSGGAHLYLFLEKPLPAEFVRIHMISWASALGFPSVEIFPKQNRLANDKDVGNWINMPYFGGTRPCIRDGNILTATEFILYANEKKATRHQVEKAEINDVLEAADFLDGPPCLQALTANGFPEGTRNNGLLALGVYAKLKYGDDFAEKVVEYNEKYMSPPLSNAEVKQLLKSLSKKDYFYACDKTPLNQFCNKDVCKTRGYGIGGETSTINIGGLTKIDSNPPMWILEVESCRFEVKTTELLNQDKFRLLCMERINMLPPKMKPDRYERIINDRLKSVIIVEAPADAGPEGRFYNLLESFCTGRAQAKLPEEMLRGLPYTEDGLTHFRSGDLFKYLEQQHFKDLSDREIWTILRRDDRVKHGKFKIKGASINYWAIPEFEKQREPFDIPKVEDEAF